MKKVILPDPKNHTIYPEDIGYTSGKIVCFRHDKSLVYLSRTYTQYAFRPIRLEPTGESMFVRENPCESVAMALEGGFDVRCFDDWEDIRIAIEDNLF